MQLILKHHKNKYLSVDLLQIVTQKKFSIGGKWSLIFPITLGSPDHFKKLIVRYL